MEKNFNIQISSETILKAIAFLVFFYFLYLIKDVVLVVLTAIVIASSVEPATKWFGKRKIPRLPAVVITYVISIAILAGIFYMIAPSILDDASNFISKLPEYTKNINMWNPLEGSQVAEPTANLMKGFSVNSSSFSISETILNLKNALTNTTEGFLRTMDAIFGGILSFILVIVLSFYLAVQENGVSNFLKVITPIRNQDYVVDLWERSQRKIGLWMQGQLFLALIIAVLVFLCMAVLGVKGALLLAIVAGVFELIPVFGPILSAIPAIAIAYTEGVPAIGEVGVTAAIVVAGCYLIIHQLENHLIYPLVVRKIIGVSPVVVIISLIIGFKLAGFIGIILAVPVASALMEYFYDIQRRKMSEKEKLAQSA